MEEKKVTFQEVREAVESRSIKSSNIIPLKACPQASQKEKPKLQKVQKLRLTPILIEQKSRNPVKHSRVNFNALQFRKNQFSG